MGRALDQADVGPLWYLTLLLRFELGKRLRTKGFENVKSTRSGV
jgi:hypothetical protein